MACAALVAVRETPVERPPSVELVNLDLLRSVAVGLVFMDHLTLTAKIRFMGMSGHFGVLLFFVHTALVLLMSMDRYGFSGAALYKAFLIRRIFRIYPLSILTVLTVVCLHLPANSWLGGYHWPGWPVFFSNLFLIQNLAHARSLDCVLWSLPFEVQMYALLPLLFLAAARLPGRAGMGGLWLLSAGIAMAEFLLRPGSQGGSSSSILVTEYFPCFFAGAFAWRAMAGRRPRLPGWGWPCFLFLAIFGYRMIELLRGYGPHVLGVLHGVLRNDHQSYWSWPPWVDMVLAWLLCAAVGCAIPHFQEIRSSWLKNSSKLIARYSYGIYMCHVPILWFFFDQLRLGPVALRAALSVLFTALVSVAAYHCLEEPAIRLGNRLSGSLVARRVHE